MHQIFNKALLTAALSAAIITTSAQSPEADGSIISHVNGSTSVEVILPDALASRLNPAKASASESESDSESGTESLKTAIHKTGGYRVQIFSDNNVRTAKNEARTKAKTIAATFPQYPTYVVYSSPYWRLKVGDFKSHEEAEVAATQIKRAFPAYAREIRVVRDRINVKN